MSNQDITEQGEQYSEFEEALNWLRTLGVRYINSSGEKIAIRMPGDEKTDEEVYHAIMKQSLPKFVEGVRGIRDFNAMAWSLGNSWRKNMGMVGNV